MKSPPLFCLAIAAAALTKCYVSAKFTFPENDRMRLIDDINVKHASTALYRSVLSNPQLKTYAKRETDSKIEEIGTGPGGGRLLRVKRNKGETTAKVSSEEITDARIPRKLKKGRKEVLKKKKNSNKTSKVSKIKKLKKNKKEKKLEKNACTNLVAENGDWKTWLPDITTFTPIFRPSTDAELSGIIVSSKRFGCKVRMMGSRHSQDGLVMQRKEENIIVVSLASHATDIKEWQDSINQETSTFRIGAGKSWFDVSALIRPNGYVLKSRSAGAFFSVGGVIANMVHGGGRSTGFMHDDVVRMLVLTSDGNFKEVEGEDLKFWRSSAGLLGMIIAIEMEMHSESIPFVVGINPSSGEPIFDITKGGLLMDRERTLFQSPNDEAEFPGFIQRVMEKVYNTHAIYDSAQFFFDFYSNSLAEYRTSFSGEIFSGATGPYADVEKVAKYKAHTENLSELYSDVSFTGGKAIDLNEEIICQIFCLPPSGPPPIGDGTPCEKIPSSFDQEKFLCEVPIEVAAALSISLQDTLDGQFELASSTTNDGFFLTDPALFDLVIVILPARALSSAFGTWYGLVSSALTHSLPNINFFPNLNLEFRFLNPTETAVLNALPTIEETRAAFNERYNFFGPNAFDILLPPLPEGVPDGYVAVECPNVRNIFDKDAKNFLFALQEAWKNMPTNPFFPYSDLVVKDCDAQNDVLPCSPTSLVESKKCCNPVIPTYHTHFGKAWGYGVDDTTTPTTSKMQPFKDTSSILNMFDTGSKKNTVESFNAKRKDLDAEVFAGGAMMRWLDPAAPNSDFEVRMLNGQKCGSFDFQSDPDKECISDQCFDSKCVE
mmetsp:Transcript_46238/g.55654  ORF Transcript_46238/g.55654 Transcript_46238/m.55654 type:complete len:830 (+) Transcript_46238:259-2748(+)